MPIGLLPSAESWAGAQFIASPEAVGQTRSSDAEQPSAPTGHGERSAYFTLSIVSPVWSESVTRSPLFLNVPKKFPSEAYCQMWLGNHRAHGIRPDSRVLDDGTGWECVYNPFGKFPSRYVD